MSNEVGSPEAGTSAGRVVYEIDLGEGQAGASSAAAPEASTGEVPAETAARPAPTTDPYLRSLEARVETSERYGRDLLTSLVPLLQEARTRQQPPDPNAPRFRSLEELDSRTDLRPSDLGRYLQHQVDEGLRRTALESERMAQRTLSTERARGQFSREALGDGVDYETLSGTYVRPMVDSNPAVRDLILAANPENPALAEMMLGAICWGMDQVKTDPVKGLRMFFDTFRSKRSGAEEVLNRIDQAATSHADRMFSSAPGATVQSTKLDAQEMWNMSDERFNRLVDATR
jgi:hypothetical protein